MNVLLAGATGYVGRRLKLKLLEEKDVHLRLLVREARQLSDATRATVEVVEGGLRDIRVVKEAVKGMDVVYYPIRVFGAVWEHEEQDERAVEMFRDACVEAGVKRLVYVGLHVTELPSVPMLKAIAEKGRILSGRPESIQTMWVRVGVLLGSGSVLFELLRNIVQKIPVIACSRWMDVCMRFTDMDELLAVLVRVKDIEGEGNMTVVSGSSPMTFKEMLRSASRVMDVSRTFVPVPFGGRRLSAVLLMLATPFSFRLSSHLIQAFQSGEVTPCCEAEQGGGSSPERNSRPAFERLFEKALGEIENDQVTSRWVDTLDKKTLGDPEQDVSRAVYRDVKQMDFGQIPRHKVFQAIKSIGGNEGWFTFDFLWRIRGFLDKLAGGFGTAMGKRTASDLRVGDMLDVWRVADIREDSRLLLEAQMKVFGKAWLEFTIEGNTLTQIAYHHPSGLLGKLYWHCMVPFHFFIFRDMIRNIVRQAAEKE